MRRCSRLPSIAIVATLAWACTASAADRIADVRSLEATALAANPPVRIRGVVTRARQSSLFVQDESAGIYVNIARGLVRGVMPRDQPRPAVAQGDEVEIEGVADPGGFSPIVLPAAIRVLGRCPLPATRPVDAEQFFAGVADSQFVEATGIVQEVVEHEDHWRLAMASGSRPFLASIAKPIAAGDPRELIDAEVRVRGPTSSLSNTRGEFLMPWVFVEAADLVDVVTPRPCAPFEGPRIPAGMLARFQTAPVSHHMVRTEGTVIHAEPGEQLFIQDGAAGVRVTSHSAIDVVPGDRVEVAGFVRRDAHAAGLAHAIVRRLAGGSPPEPVVITPGRIMAVNMDAVRLSINATPGDYDGCLVRFPARLLDVQRDLFGGRLILATGSTTLAARVSKGTLAERGDLVVGSEVEATGIAHLKWELDPLAWGKRQPSEVTLLVRNAADLRVVRPPSPWTVRRLAMLLGTSAAVLVLTTVWGWSLRRKSGQLEVMVADRTRELAVARDREKQVEVQARATLQQKLKASLAASAVAHEINQPLSRILLRCRMDLDEAEDSREAIRAIVADADRVVTTIDKMKVLLRNVETEHADVDLVQVVESSMVHLKQFVAAHSVTVRRPPPPGSCVIRGDDVQLQMVVTNLVRNAVEALVETSGGRREIEIAVAQVPGAVRLTVGDSGPGWKGGVIDQSLLATTKPEGSGIGLFIIQTAVENHGGTVEVGRGHLGGAEFRVTFPAGGRGSAA